MNLGINLKKTYFSVFRNKLRDLLEVVLVSELEKLYDLHWIKIVKVKPAETKPFWNLTGLFDALRLHHEAVFTVYYPENGSSLKRCLQSLTEVDESNNTPRRKIDDLIPGILQLCSIVEARGELPKSVCFFYSSFELARSTREETKRISRNWRGKVESTEKEENEKSEGMEQDERNYKGMEQDKRNYKGMEQDERNYKGMEQDERNYKGMEEDERNYKGLENHNKNEIKRICENLEEIGVKKNVKKVDEVDDELDEDEEEEGEEEEEEEDVCKTLLANVWHMVACVTFSMCSIWDCKGDLEPVEPEYKFKDRREVEERVEGFISEVQIIGKLMESLVELRRCMRTLEQGWSEVTRLVPLLNTFRNNIKDDQAGFHAHSNQ